MEKRIILSSLLVVAYATNIASTEKETSQLNEAEQAAVDVPHEWEKAEQTAKNAVVQVLAQQADFNWTEPFSASRQKQGCGSGFFINAEGYLLTNYHVVEGAQSVQVCIPALGRRLIDVTVEGACPRADIALLKLEPVGKEVILQELGKIPFLKLGDSEELKPVEPVLALGYPLGLRYIKSTVGVLGGREYFEGTSFMHITAPINPGNSGGPLLNRKGSVVGINSAGIFGEAQNMGYIIPINYAKILLDDLFTQKLLHKPVLGISTNHTTEEQARLLKNPWPAGVYINNVQEGSVAYTAGIRAGDMLYAINGFTVDPFGDVVVEWRSARKVSLGEFIINLRVNTALTFTIYRKGQKKELKGILTVPALQPIRKIYPDFEMHELDYEVIGGLCVMQLRYNHFDILQDTFSLRKYKAPENAGKSVLVITHIMPGSYADRIHCFYAGDILTSINDQKVHTVADVRKALRSSKRSGVISITTKDKISTVLSVNKLLLDEPRITRDCKFSTTAGIKSLS